MVNPVTLYGVTIGYDLEELAKLLETLTIYRSEAEFLGRKIQLGLKTEKVELRQNSLFCIVSDSFLSAVKVDGEILKLPVTKRTTLGFVLLGSDIYLLVFSRKKEADKLVNILSEELFKKPDAIYGLIIPSIALDRIYGAENVEVKQIVYESAGSEEDVRTIVYFGKNLAAALPRGKGEKNLKIKYILYRDEVGVFGISTHGIVVSFTQLSQDELISYIVEKILPLAEPPS